ncbi:MAG: hypothetical protein ACLVBP_03210 [Ruminococcus sp.]
MGADQRKTSEELVQYRNRHRVSEFCRKQNGKSAKIERLVVNPISREVLL